MWGQLLVVAPTGAADVIEAKLLLYSTVCLIYCNPKRAIKQKR